MGKRSRGTEQVKYVGNTDVFYFGFNFMGPKWTRTKLMIEISLTSETEEIDDDSEPNNKNVNNYLDSANMATNLESAMKIAEEEDSQRLLLIDPEASHLATIQRWENT